MPALRRLYPVKPRVFFYAALLTGTALTAASASAAEPTRAPTLSSTAPLAWPEADLSTRLMDGAHAFAERQIAESLASRPARWSRDFSSPTAYARSVEPNRARFQSILGVVDARLPVALERYGDDTQPALVAETARYRVWQVRWPVLDGVWGSGLHVEPTTPPVAQVIFVPDADQTPEHYLGLAPGLPPAAQTARRLAENGIELLLPVTVSRTKLTTENTQLRRSDQTQREWIYRQAFHLGRHVIGYEIQIVLAAADYLRTRRGGALPLGLAGYAEGGQTALYAAALDTRFSAALVSGYFDSRQQVWSEPIYRNVWSLLREFGDAEIAGLVLPRALVIEHTPTPTLTGHKGDWRTPDFARVQAEVLRIAKDGRLPAPLLVRADAHAFADESLAAFARSLGLPSLAPVSAAPPVDRRAAFVPATRTARLFRELETHVQSLVQKSDQVRDAAFLHTVMPELAENTWSTKRRLPTHSAEKFIAGARPYRERFHAEAMGRFDAPLLPFNARTRQIAATAKWTAYDVVIDVWPEVFAWGILVVPSDLRPGERRPVVVCQGGRNSLPRDTLEGDNPAYNNFSAALAERGFITFAPFNLYRGEDRYRYLSRKANTVGASLFSFIVAQHDQILRWLDTQPFVDGKRIAFYGLSYGGETAMRVPTILEKYFLSICSGDFNQWTRKVAATDQPFSFMRTIEWEMPYWNLGPTFDYAEMAYLMIPRPFMVERGHLDRVGRDSWVAHEYAKVAWLYAQLGLADRTRIEYFQGGHSINGEGTFDFLHHHLAWPKPAAAPTP
jgi:dienelactone hydrolase